MSTYPIIFPSLSRQPSMDSSKTIEDDTIRDQAESGYVSARPRYTRARRTWKQNVRNLQLEDIRALDEFVMSVAQRGGNAFLYPNLLANWSFEFPAVSPVDLVWGWNVNSMASEEAVAINTAMIADGTQAITFGTVAGTTVAGNATASSELDCDALIPCKPGEVYTFNLQMNAVQGTLPSGALIPAAGVRFLDGNGAQLSASGFNFAVSAGWNQVGNNFTIPANAASFQFYLFVQVQNPTGATLNLDGSASVTFDEVGCALLTPLTPYGRMIGSTPLGTYVRFTKLPESSDIGFGGGVKRYGVNFELTEV